MTMFYYIN